MNLFEEGIDPELRIELIDESLDSLGEVADMLVQLESDPSNQDVVQAIFRPVHSMKGNAAYFGLLKTKALAHEMETLLDLIRKGALLATSEIIDILLKGVDEIVNMLKRGRENKSEVDNQQYFDELISKISHAAQSSITDEVTLWENLLKGLENVEEKSEQEQKATISELRKLAIDIAKNSPIAQTLFKEHKEPETRLDVPCDLAILKEIINNDEAITDAEEIINLLDNIKNLCENDSAEVIKEAIADIQLIINSVGIDDPLAKDSLREHIQNIENNCKFACSETESTLEPTQETAQENKKTESKKQEPHGKTMRIPEESIDDFLSYVGDLVTIRERYQHVHTSMVTTKDTFKSALELRRVNEAFVELSLSLQNSIMKIRKVPLNNIIQRAPRIVRDIASMTNKNIKTIVKGGNIEVDKSLIDALEAPFVHMVRNAADHGIEKPEQRLEKGKDEQGIVSISARESEDFVFVEIVDDGAGLNREALKKKAVEIGLIPENQELTDEDMVNLLFQSGVSTAEQITEISGRGVGMDVAKREIEELGGNIGISSKTDKGSTFTITLPKSVSTQILTGYIVVVGNNRYVFPLEKVVRCFRPEPDQLATIFERGNCVQDGDHMLDIFNLSDIFGVESVNNSHYTQGIMVIIETKNGNIALHVDQIEGVRQIVLKDIEGLLGTDSLFKGGAVMGDGSVAMVVEMEKMLEYHF